MAGFLIFDLHRTYYTMLLLDISSWWQSTPFFEKIFWVIAILFSTLFLIQAVLSFTAGDGDAAMGDSDASIDHDAGIGYHFFTIKNMIAFFTVFGWTGIACIRGDVSKPWTIVAALIAGSLMVVMMAFLFLHL